MAKLNYGCVNLRDHALRASAKMNRFAAPFVRRTFANYPALAFQPVQQCYKRGLFYPKMCRNLRLGQRAWSNRQMQQRPPFCLAHPHRSESIVQFEPPGTSGAVQQRTEYIQISVHGVQLVSMLTNSDTRDVSNAQTTLNQSSLKGSTPCGNRSFEILGAAGAASNGCFARPHLPFPVARADRQPQVADR